MQHEKFIIDARQKWNEVMQNLAKFPDPAQVLEEVIQSVEWLNEEGDRTSYCYYFMVEGHDMALTITTLPDHIDAIIEPDHYVRDYEAAKKVADEFAYFYQKPVSVLEDNTEIVVYIAKPVTIYERQARILEARVLKLMAERDALTRELHDINQKNIHVPMDDKAIRSIFGLDDDADVSHITREIRTDIQDGMEQAFYDYSDWETIAGNEADKFSHLFPDNED